VVAYASFSFFLSFFLSLYSTYAADEIKPGGGDSAEHEIKHIVDLGPPHCDLLDNVLEIGESAARVTGAFQTKNVRQE
jgi:hypothetical protein